MTPMGAPLSLGSGARRSRRRSLGRDDRRAVLRLDPPQARVVEPFARDERTHAADVVTGDRGVHGDECGKEEGGQHGPATRAIEPAFTRKECTRPRVRYARTMRLRSVLALLALLLPSVACDQATKALAVAHLKGAGTIHVVDSLFTLVYAENPGAFLGLGRALPDTARYLLFVVAVGLVLGGAAFVMMRKHIAPLAFIGMAFVVAGGAGNLVDRVARPGGRVVDFAQLGVKTPWLHLRTGIFNIADVQIMGGAALVLLSTWRTRKKDDPVPEPQQAS